jgi:hypothetical protein
MIRIMILKNPVNRLTWKLPGVPGEVLLAVRVLNVQPHHVHGDIMLVEFRVHLLYTVHIKIWRVFPTTKA